MSKLTKNQKSVAGKVEAGKEYSAWVTIITTTPSHFWEISSSLDEKLHVEQLYKSVDIRFDTVVWPEE